jgi:protein TonB
VSRRPWHGLALSLAFHAAVLALVLVVVSRDEMLPALMIDLREPFVPGAGSVASAPREEQPARPRPPARSKRSAAIGERTTVVAAPTPPTPSAPIALPPPAVVEAPPSPPPLAVTTEPSRDPAPAASVGPTPSIAGGEAATTDAGTIGGASASSDRGGVAGEPGGLADPRVAAAPSGATGSGAGAEYGPYLTALRERIQQSVRYPASARRRGLGGTVSVEILILANGSIADVTLLESSSHAVLDDAALDTIRSLPRMPLPPELPARPLRVRVPVVFQMR